MIKFQDVHDEIEVCGNGQVKQQHTSWMCENYTSELVQLM